MGIRCVVTGHNNDGQAVFASDEVVELVTLDLLPGAEFYRLWGGDTTASFPDSGGPPAGPQYFPGVGGFRFGLFTVSPDASVMLEDLDIDAALTEMEQKLPGMAAHMEPDSPGMHTTATIDYEFVVAGRVVLELDDGGCAPRLGEGRSTAMVKEMDYGTGTGQSFAPTESVHVIRP